MIDQIEWIACAERVPDDDQTVLMYVPGYEVCAGWHEDAPRYDSKHGWRLADGTPTDGVTHWAELPDGPA